MMVIAFIVIVLFAIWVASIIALLAVGLNAWMDDKSVSRRMLFFVGAAFLVFAIPMSFIFANAGDDDPHRNRLCLSGRQKWVTTSNGKTRETHKEWICSSWE